MPQSHSSQSGRRVGPRGTNPAWLRTAERLVCEFIPKHESESPDHSKGAATLGLNEGSLVSGEGLFFFNRHVSLAAPFHRRFAIPQDCREVGRFLVLPARPDHIRRGEFGRLTPSW
jgi:hypothetical protein